MSYWHIILECNYGTFGQNCSQRCSCEGASCDHVNGTCSQGKCESGWTGLACNISNVLIKLLIKIKYKVWFPIYVWITEFPKEVNK